jgi:hypothetical protein
MDNLEPTQEPTKRSRRESKMVKEAPVFEQESAGGQENIKPKSKPNSMKKLIKTLGIVIVVVICALGIYSTVELYKTKSPDYQQKLLEKETEQTLMAVGKIFELPEGTPQIGIVSNADELKASQAFFEKAVNGDKLIIYESIAILYRPSAKKVINVAAVNRENPAPVSPEQTFQQEEVVDVSSEDSEDATQE